MSTQTGCMLWILLRTTFLCSAHSLCVCVFAKCMHKLCPCLAVCVSGDGVSAAARPHDFSRAEPSGSGQRNQSQPAQTLMLMLADIFPPSFSLCRGFIVIHCQRRRRRHPIKAWECGGHVYTSIYINIYTSHLPCLYGCLPLGT